VKGHFHTDAVHLGITALGVAVAFQVIRILAGKIAGSDSGPVSNLGKAVGGFFSFPSGT
jgi:hypothetical protein